MLSEAIGPVSVRRALDVLVPRNWTWSHSESTAAAAIAEVAQVLATREDVRTGDVELMAAVIGRAIEGLVEGAIRSQPELLDRPAFRAELVELIVCYLRASPP